METHAGTSKNLSPSPKELMGFISFGGLYLCLGGGPIPGYVPGLRDLILMT